MYSFYVLYLQVDRAQKIIEAAGGEVEDAHVTKTAGWFKNQFEKDLEDFTSGKTKNPPYYYRYPEVRVVLKVPESAYSEEGRQSYPQRRQEEQEWREGFIKRITQAHPEITVARFDSESVLFFQSYLGIGVSIQVGQALCEQVLVGEEVEEVPDPELLAEAVKDVPLVKKVTPKYEWRCNDAELFTTGA